MVYTWDFTGGAGAGVLNAYWDGAVPTPSMPVTDATALVGTPTRIYLGPAVSATYCQSPPCIGSLAIWDDVMTAPQAAELYAQGVRHRIAEGDGTGDMTLLATFDGVFDADVAGGSPTFAALEAAEKYCLVNDGLRYPGKRIFALGTPRHDLSEDDRVPLYVPLRPWALYGREAYLTATNNTNYSELEVAAGFASDRGVGCTFAGPPVYPVMSLTPPCTYRQKIHVLSAENPKGKHIRIGPVDYFHAPMDVGSLYDGLSSGRSFSVVADGGNSATQFKTDLNAAYIDDYWNGADVTFLTGTCAGRRLKATDYTQADKIMLVEGALPATPTAGDVGVVDFRAVIKGCLSDSNTVPGERVEAMTMDAWLWDAYSTNYHFTELDWCYSRKWNPQNLDAINLLRYERGRTAYMDGIGYNNWPDLAPWDQGFAYGRPSHWQNDSAFYCDLLLERIEVEGPSTYQILRRDASGHGPAYADNFMLTGQTGEGTKVWRKRNVTRATAKPVKITNLALTKADLEAANTWRHVVVSPPIPVETDETGAIIALLGAADSGGVVSYGYIRGVWDDGTGRITWADETPPAGKSNPVVLASELRPRFESDAMCYAGWMMSVLPGTSGDEWYFVYGCYEVNDDHERTYLVGPCPDRWTFDRKDYWWWGNPVVNLLGGPDRLAPEANGGGDMRINRASEYYIVENPYTKDPSRRYWGWTRGKTINDKWLQNAMDCRPIAGIRGADLRSMAPLPYGNQLTPLVGCQVHNNNSWVYRQSDCFMQYSDTATAASSGVYCYVSEDGVHWQAYADHTVWLPKSELVGEGNRLYGGRPFILGDRVIYYYAGVGVVANFAWCRVDGECWYALDGGQTSGLLETPLIEQPVEGWGAVLVNANPGGGSLAVEVLDADEQVITGYAAGDCDAITDAVDQTVTWGGEDLSALAAEGTIRLRFVFANSGGAAPRLYRWEVTDMLLADLVVFADGTTKTVAECLAAAWALAAGDLKQVGTDLKLLGPGKNLALPEVEFTLDDADTPTERTAV